MLQRTTIKTGSPWLVASQLKTHAKCRLFIFPSSGAGGNTFFPWCNAAPHDVEVLCVQYPGRGTRFAEAPAKSIDSFVSGMLADDVFMKTLSQKPFAFLGHSIGAAIAFELTLELQRRESKLPFHLWLSSRQSPDSPCTPKSNLSREDTIALLKKLGGTPTEVLENEQMVEVLLPILKSDWSANENYTSKGTTILNVPLSVMYGLDDSEDVKKETMLTWKSFVSEKQPFDCRSFEGDHFYLLQKSKTEAMEHVFNQIEPSLMNYINREEMEKESVFERIINRKQQATIVYEDDQCIAFNDIFPVAPIHILVGNNILMASHQVVPKKKITRLSRSMDEDEQVLGHLLVVARKVAKMHSLTDDGFRIVINDGDDGGQTVYHLHVHLLGGRPMSWPPG